MFRSLLQTIGGLVYPPHCNCCRRPLLGAHEQSLCFSCAQNIPLNVPPFCVKCSRHRRSGQAHILCQECRRYNPAFDFAWSACLYRQPLVNLIHLFKYQHRLYLKNTFTEFILRFIKQYHLDINQFDYLLPIPLYSARLRERGYNQSAILASCISRHTRLPVLTNLLIRRRYTPPQSTLQGKERWTNIQGAFTIKRPELSYGKNILLVDDLLTTGATASEAAKCLKAAQAKTIGVLTLAIT